jgi:diacylglycerol kinase family enzyme
LHEVINALHGSTELAGATPFKLPSPPILVLPSGTGNGVATSLGIRSPVDAAVTLLHGQPTPLDLMSVSPSNGGESVLSVLSLAWAAIADSDTLSEGKLRWLARLLPGVPLIPLAIMLRSRSYRGTVAFTPHAKQRLSDITAAHEIGSDGRVLLTDDFLLVHICNLSWIAYDVLVAPGVAAGDGCFGIFVLRRGVSRLQWIRILLEADGGDITRFPCVELYLASEATVTPENCGPDGIYSPFVVDGENMAGHAPSVRVASLPGAARTLERAAHP